MDDLTQSTKDFPDTTRDLPDPFSFFGGDNGGGSLLVADAQAKAAQPELPLALSELVHLELESGDRTYTGERLFRDRRPVYDAVVELLGENVSIRRIARALKVSQDTIRAVAHREGIPISALRLKLRDLCTAGAIALAERVVEDPDAVPNSAVAITLDVLTRNALLLDGQATSISEHRETVTIDDFNAYVDSLPSAGMGSPGEISPAMAAPRAAQAALAAPGLVIEATVPEVPASGGQAPGSGADEPRKPPK